MHACMCRHTHTHMNSHAHTHHMHTQPCLIRISRQGLALDDLKIGLFEAITGLGLSLILLLIMKALRGRPPAVQLARPLCSLEGCSCHQPPTHVYHFGGPGNRGGVPHLHSADPGQIGEMTSPLCPPIRESKQQSVHSLQRPSQHPGSRDTQHSPTMSLGAQQPVRKCLFSQHSTCIRCN